MSLLDRYTLKRNIQHLKDFLLLAQQANTLSEHVKYLRFANHLLEVCLDMLKPLSTNRNAPPARIASSELRPLEKKLNTLLAIAESVAIENLSPIATPLLAENKNRLPKTTTEPTAAAPTPHAVPLEFSFPDNPGVRTQTSSKPAFDFSVNTSDFKIEFGPSPETKEAAQVTRTNKRLFVKKFLADRKPVVPVSGVKRKLSMENSGRFAKAQSKQQKNSQVEVPPTSSRALALIPNFSFKLPDILSFIQSVSASLDPEFALMRFIKQPIAQWVDLLTLVNTEVAPKTRPSNPVDTTPEACQKALVPYISPATWMTRLLEHPIPARMRPAKTSDTLARIVEEEELPEDTESDSDFEQVAIEPKPQALHVASFPHIQPPAASASVVTGLARVGIEDDWQVLSEQDYAIGTPAKSVTTTSFQP